MRRSDRSPGRRLTCRLASLPEHGEGARVAGTGHLAGEQLAARSWRRPYPGQAGSGPRRSEGGPEPRPTALAVAPQQPVRRGEPATALYRQLLPRLARWLRRPSVPARVHRLACRPSPAPARLRPRCRCPFLTSRRTAGPVARADACFPSAPVPGHRWGRGRGGTAASPARPQGQRTGGTRVNSDDSDSPARALPVTRSSPNRTFSVSARSAGLGSWRLRGRRLRPAGVECGRGGDHVAGHRGRVKTWVVLSRAWPRIHWMSVSGICGSRAIR